LETLAGISTAHWPDRRHCHWQEHRGALTAGSAGARAVLDRAALGAIVFTQPAEKAWLEALVRPLLRARFEQELSDLREQPTVVLMIPLLFEAVPEELCSEIWLEDCEPTQQLESLMQRDALGAAKTQAEVDAQNSKTKRDSAHPRVNSSAHKQDKQKTKASTKSPEEAQRKNTNSHMRHATVRCKPPFSELTFN
jgi:dephospho-CoA kinase